MDSIKRENNIEKFSYLINDVKDKNCNILENDTVKTKFQNSKILNNNFKELFNDKNFKANIKEKVKI